MQKHVKYMIIEWKNTSEWLFLFGFITKNGLL